MAGDKVQEVAAPADQISHAIKTALYDLQKDVNLWYRIHVLICDLCHIKNDRVSESRTLCTTDELYISGPYFTPSESALIKATILQDMGNTKVPTETGRDIEEPTTVDEATPAENLATLGVLTVKREAKTIEDAIKEKLAGFFDKRKASGDSRPCGPHDMAPIYESVFNIKHSALEEAQFLGRLRRSGLDDSTEEKETPPKKKKKKGKNGKNGW